MKLVAISVVKNDADIIEAYVRHTRAWADHHLIFDHDSTDGTREILGALSREGLPLTVYTGESVANFQQSRSHHLAQLAFTAHAADWVLPLDADEFLVMPGGREALERALAALRSDQPASVPLRNYVPTSEDDPQEPNPVIRLRHAQRRVSTTVKTFTPRQLGLDPAVQAGMGNHVVCRGDEPLAAQPLPGAWLAHYALRSPAQQAIRILSGELQKISRGRAAEGLALHYRLGFQLLAEDPERFFSTLQQPAHRFACEPAPYFGGPLRHTPRGNELARAARALVPFLEKLAVSHGRLTDQVNATAAAPAEEIIRPLDPATLAAPLTTDAARFSGFEPRSGWQPAEGPVPEAFLPRFHWATGPETCLAIHSAAARTATFTAEALSYAERQVTTVLLNGEPVLEANFPRVNQKENLRAPLALLAGENLLVFRHTTWIESAADPRKLALIFLSLRVD